MICLCGLLLVTRMVTILLTIQHIKLPLYPTFKHLFPRIPHNVDEAVRVVDSPNCMRGNIVKKSQTSNHYAIECQLENIYV